MKIENSQYHYEKRGEQGRAERFGTQVLFAKKVGINEQVVSRIITGRQKLPLLEQERWARVLKCRVEEIFEAEAVQV